MPAALHYKGDQGRAGTGEWHAVVSAGCRMVILVSPSERARQIGCECLGAVSHWASVASASGGADVCAESGVEIGREICAECLACGSECDNCVPFVRPNVVVALALIL